MYNEHFGLHDQPFSIAPDPRYLFMSERHREALAHLLYGIRKGAGFVLLTGEIGTGKTTICRCLLEQLPADTRVAYIINPRLSALELLATICGEFGIPCPEGNSSKLFIDRLNAFLLDSHASGRQTVLIIDEAQNLSADVLEQIRLLTNLETNRRKLLQIILIGQPELRALLARPDLRQLAQRITARYHLQALSKREISSYVSHRLAVAGVRRPLFPPRLISSVFRLSGGIPRRINILCDRALMGAYVQGRERVTGRILSRAAREVWPQRTFSLHWAAGLLLIGILAFIPKFLLHEDPPAAQISTAVFDSAPVAVPDSFVARPFAGSREQAFQAILSTWGVEYQPGTDGDPCQYAGKFGLACLPRSGSLGSLRLLNRPAVLTVTDEKGGKAHAALIGLGGESARFLFAGQMVDLHYREMERRWLGEFTILWRQPPFDGIIRPGDRGPQVEWLAQQLSVLNGGEKQEGSKGIYKGKLLSGLKEFQRTRGIGPDGVVGPTTLIHLDSTLGGNSPQLHDDPEGG
jgi:general secretion pathway protein A